MATPTKAKGEEEASAAPRKRASGIPTGNAGEYLAMGELLRRGFDAQLADRNTRGYDILAGSVDATRLMKIQVKTVLAQPWYVRASQLQSSGITIFVLLGPKQVDQPVRFFIAPNAKIAAFIHHPRNWVENGFMSLKVIEPYENRWDLISRTRRF